LGVVRPYIRKDELDDEASLFLNRFSPACLRLPLAVPALQIAADMGITIIQDKYLLEDESILGMMCFDDGDVEYFDDRTGYYERVKVGSGTMLIDPRVKLSRNEGCYNTVIHELFHWYRHKEYFQSLPPRQGMAVCATRCTKRQIEGVSSPQRTTDLDWIEWQASSIAPRILMPRDSFEQVASKTIRNNEGLFQNKKYYLYQAIADIAEVFHVSRRSARIRLMETGYFDRYFI